MIGHYITLVINTLCDVVTTCFWPVGLLLVACEENIHQNGLTFGIQSKALPPPSTFLIWIMSQVWLWIDWILAEFCWRKMTVLTIVSLLWQGFVCPCCQRWTALVLHKNKRDLLQAGPFSSLSLSLDRVDDRRTYDLLARISSVPWKIHGDDYNYNSSSKLQLKNAYDGPSCSDLAISTNYSVQIQYSL